MLDRVVPVRLMAAPVVLVAALLAVVQCTRRVRSPADLRPALVDVPALVSVLALVDLAPGLVARVLVAVA